MSVQISCPECGGEQGFVESYLTVKRIGSYSLAGAQIKMAATQSVRLVCMSCGYAEKGEESDERAAIRDIQG